MMDEERVRQSLLKAHPLYQSLAEEHHKLDERLDELKNKRYLSPEEQTEERRIKKRKLQLKDRMYAILSGVRNDDQD